MIANREGRCFAAIAAAVAFAVPAAPASAELVYALTTQNSVAVFDSADPSAILDGGSVRNLPGSVDLEAIDYRAATGEIYLLDDMENVYTFDPASFEASVVGTFSPRIPGLSFAFDFNPAFMGGQFARIITDTNDNRVISGDTGQYLPPVEKTDVFYAAGDPNEGADPNVAGIAYTNSFGVPSSTQQYGIDSRLGVLVTVANNAGTLQTVGSLGVGPLTNELGFDISGATGVAYAALQSGPNSMLYTIDLGTGAATLVDQIAAGDLIRSLTVIPVPEPTGFALASLAGLGLLRRRG
ncbi:DUF4394 domain-containing protein [Botrimarina sp.]|uniref:DUF4394 domain-containing protein n=1 Tax=Botrimarina sp. TaxID=2795802 RepID=UPI0032EE4193